MRYLKWVVISVLSIFLLVACQQLSPEEKAINDLIQQAEQYLDKIKSVNIDDLQKTRGEAKELESKIAVHFAQLKDDARSILSQVANNTKAFRKTHFNPTELGQDYQHNIDQLKNLLEDYKHQAISKDEFEKYLLDEKRAMDIINSKADKALSNISFIKESYDKLLPKAKHLSDSLK